jgi:hypothetical protein
MMPHETPPCPLMSTASRPQCLAKSHPVLSLNPPLQSSRESSSSSLLVCRYVTAGGGRAQREASNREVSQVPPSRRWSPLVRIRTALELPWRHLEACGYNIREVGI